MNGQLTQGPKLELAPVLSGLSLTPTDCHTGEPFSKKFEDILEKMNIGNFPLLEDEDDTSLFDNHLESVGMHERFELDVG